MNVDLVDFQLDAQISNLFIYNTFIKILYMFRVLTHCGRVSQICVFNTVKLGTSASSP